MMRKRSRIFVAGHRGMIGGAVLRGLRTRGFKNLCFRNRSLLDLRKRNDVFRYFERVRPEGVVMCAGEIRESGAGDNILNDNLVMGENLVEACEHFEVRRLVYMASSCVYPAKPRRMLDESLLLSDQLRCADSRYGVAKIMCLKLGEAMNELGRDSFVSLVPSCVYGPRDRYRAGPTSWIPSLYLRMVLAKQNGTRSVTCLEPCSPFGELLYVDDLASACVLALNLEGGHRVMNVSNREICSVESLAERIARLVDFNGAINYELNRVGKYMGRRLDSSKIERLGWKPKITIDEGLRRTIRDLKERRNWATKLGGDATGDPTQSFAVG